MDKSIQFYNQIVEYFQSNYLSFIITVLFLVVGFIIVNFIKRRVKLRLVKKSPNHITANFISQIIAFILKSILIFSALYMLGLSSFSNKILAGAGLLTFVIGFALKDIGENFLAGIVLAFKSPFRLNDLIEVNGIIGHVKDISIRETLVKTPDGKDVFLPNSIIIKNPLFNYTLDGFLRYEFIVGIAYENSPTKAFEIIDNTLKKIEGVLKGDRKPIISIDELATNTINLKVLFWINTFKSTKRSVHYSVRSEVMDKVLAALISEGFSLPASIVELKNYDLSNSLKVNFEKKRV